MKQPETGDTVYSMDADMEMGVVSLLVADLERSLPFYEGVLGCAVLAHSSMSAVLGGDHPLLLLTEHKGNSCRSEQTTGLYHLALLLPSRVDLACALRHLLDSGYPLQECSDHGISEAIYLSDPEGNGIELYRDRPRSAWPWHNGRLEATEASTPLDMESLLAELDGTTYTWSSLPPATRIGHVHLQVADLEQSATFYREVLGLEESITGMSGACFFAVGGYHHHIACNVWTKLITLAPSGHAPGLNFFTLVLPEQAQVLRLVSHLSSAGIAVAQHAQAYLIHDPAHISILLMAESLQNSQELMALPSLLV